MASLEEGTWQESHLVWHLPPSACVHVTHGTWKMVSKCQESERKCPLFGIKPRNSLLEKREFGGGRKGKEKKGEKKKEGRKGKEMRKRKERENKKKGRRKERRGKQKRGGKIRAWRRKGKERKRAPIPGVSMVRSR